MTTRAPSTGALVISVAFALSCFGLLLFLWQSFGGPVPLKPQSYRVAASFEQAPLLADQAEVRISGVVVGRVVERQEEAGRTRATMELNPRYAPIPDDTRATLREKTLLGETFIELSPGTAPEDGGTRLPEGGELPPGNSQPAIKLDEILDAFDQETREAFTLTLEELADAVEDRGGDISAGLANLAPTLTESRRLADVLRSQRRAVRALIDDSQTTLEALSEREGSLSRFVRSTERVLDSTARQGQRLTETIRILPTTLREADATLDLARAVGLEARPLLDETEPVARELGPTLVDLDRATPDVVRILRDLGMVLDRGDAGVPALRTILQEARPLVPELFELSRDLRPGVAYLNENRREIVAGLVKLGASLQGSHDLPNGGRRHFLRVAVPFNFESFANAVARFPFNRHNAYPKPNYLERLTIGLDSFDCSHATGLLANFNALPCREQGDYQIGDRTFRFPQLHRDP